MNIRRATTTDDAEWLRLRDALWPGISADEHRREMADYRTDANAVFVIDRLQDGRLGGFLEASLRTYAEDCETSPVGYIEGWYVDPDLRQRGLGAALVAAAEQWARGRGCVEMGSDCLVENLISLQAHTALGYQETERLIHFRKPLANQREETQCERGC